MKYMHIYKHTHKKTQLGQIRKKFESMSRIRFRIVQFVRESFITVSHDSELCGQFQL